MFTSKLKVKAAVYFETLVPTCQVTSEDRVIVVASEPQTENKE
jgi:hypothetical protein